MKFKFPLLLSVFIFSFLSLSLVSSMDIEHVPPNFYINSSIYQIYCIDLDDYFSSYEYYTVSFPFFGELWDGCISDRDDYPTNCWYEMDGYFYLQYGYLNSSLVGYGYYLGGEFNVPAGDSHYVTNYYDDGEFHNYVCLSHDISDSIWDGCTQNHWAPFSVFPLEILVGDYDEDYVSQISIRGDGVSCNQTNITDSHTAPASTSHPVIKKYFSDLSLGNDSSKSYFLDDYFSNYDSVVVDIYFGDVIRTISLGKLEYAEECVGDSDVTDIPMTFCLSSVYQFMELTVYNAVANYSLNVSVTAVNPYGFAYDSFVVTGTGQGFMPWGSSPEYPEKIVFNETTGKYEAYEGSSFVGYLASLLGAIFPNKDSLNISYRFGYIFVVALLINLGGLFLFIGTQNTKFAGLVLLILNACMFFYFVAIGYVPAVVIISLVFLLVAIPLFKSKVIG